MRPPARGAAVKALGHWWDDQDIREDFGASTDNEYRSVVDKAFRPFLAWRATCGLHANVNSVSAAPGDFAFTYTKDGVNLGIVGLNTATLQLTGRDYRGQLTLEARQLQVACGGNAPVWLKKHAASLLLTHHPAHWLHPVARETLEREILGRDQFLAHFHGHVHTPNSESIKTGGGPARRNITAASLFGMEFHGNEHKEHRIHGYAAGLLNITDAQFTLRIWPRMAVRTQSGYDRLAADMSFDLDDDEAYTETIRRTALTPDQATEISSESVFSVPPYHVEVTEIVASLQSHSGLVAAALAEAMKFAIKIGDLDLRRFCELELGGYDGSTEETDPNFPHHRMISGYASHVDVDVDSLLWGGNLGRALDVMRRDSANFQPLKMFNPRPIYEIERDAVEHRRIENRQKTFMRLIAPMGVLFSKAKAGELDKDVHFYSSSDSLIDLVERVRGKLTKQLLDRLPK